MCSIYYIHYMPRAAKKQTSKCSNHQFQLIPLQSNLYFKQPVTLSYCNSDSDSKSKAKCKRKKQNCLCYPVFNRDNNFATTSFILPEQKKNYIENHTKFKMEHECRVKDYEEEKTQLLIPKPKTKQSFCNVCRINYEDYLEHIHSDYHKSSIHRASFTRHIKQLVKKYGNCQNKYCQKNSELNDTSRTISQNEDLAILGAPRKKIKRDLSNNYPLQLNQFNSFLQVPIINHSPTFHQKRFNIFPMGYLNYDQINSNFNQIPSFSNGLELYQMMPHLCSWQQQLNQNALVQKSLMLSYPLMYCNSMDNIPCFPPSYLHLPLTTLEGKPQNNIAI